MALLTCRYFSEVLGLSTTATVVLPQRTEGQIGQPGARGRALLPVLYLLHGLTDDDSIWTRRTSLERYAAALDLAIVMPAAHRSFYTDQLEGYRYFTHVAEEVPRIMASFFPLSPRREDTFVAGLSMGGYGALKLGLRLPHKFAGAASLSGALNVVSNPRLDASEWRRTFGSVESARSRGDDLSELVDRVDPASLPKLFAWCGREDWLLDDNRQFHEACVRRGIGLDYSESDGDHDWASWDKGIERVLEWLDANFLHTPEQETIPC